MNSTMVAITSPSSKFSSSTYMKLTFMLMMSTMWAFMSTSRWSSTTSTSISTSIWVKDTSSWPSTGWSTNNFHFFTYKWGYLFLKIKKCFSNYKWCLELTIIFSKTIQGHSHYIFIIYRGSYRCNNICKVFHLCRIITDVHLIFQ